MPKITRFFIRSSLICLILALLLGGSLATRPLLSLPEVLAAAGPAYLHLFMLGWVTQMIFGVALWMFPKHPIKREKKDLYPMEVACFLTLNLGLLLRIISEPIVTVETVGFLLTTLLIAAALLQWASVLLFAIIIWPRVRGR